MERRGSVFAHSPRSPASRIRGPPAPSSLRKATGQQPFWSLLSDCGSLSPHCPGPFLGSTPQSSGKESRRTHENRKPPGGRFGRGGGLSTTSGAGVLTTPARRGDLERHPCVFVRRVDSQQRGALSQLLRMPARAGVSVSFRPA